MCDRSALKNDVTTGRIKHIDCARGFGFIAPDHGGSDLYFRTTSLTSGFHHFAVGTRVRCRVRAPRSADFRPIATHIEPDDPADDLRRARERVTIARENLKRLDGASGERVERLREQLQEELREAEDDAAWLDRAA